MSMSFLKPSSHSRVPLASLQALISPSKLPPFSSHASDPSPSSPELPHRWRKRRPPRPPSPAWSEDGVLVEVSPEMASLFWRLQKDGYMKEDCFGKAEALEFGRIRVRVYEHSIGVLKNAVERFGIRHQEVAKWLSGKHLKDIALHGCPSIDKRTIYAAKSLRSFFRIKEDNVCRTCKFNASCNFANKTTGREENLVLVDVLFLLIGYALENPTLSLKHILSIEMKLAINKTLKDAVNLSN